MASFLAAMPRKLFRRAISLASHIDEATATMIRRITNVTFHRHYVLVLPRYGWRADTDAADYTFGISL
jgi:hypothetical protein